MSPIIVQIRSCPDCYANAPLTNWKPPAGYDPYMRQYECKRCHTQFYIVGGEKTYQTEALPLKES